MRNLGALTLAAALPLALGGCETIGEPTGGPTFALVNSAGQSLGSVRMWETPGGVTFRIGAAGLPHGIHGIHVHAVGRCDPPGFATAGGHWNPADTQHGFNNPAGPHRGDLPNITVAANGVLQEAVSLPGASFETMLDADGAALVIHAAADDYATDPSGNSGDRIACAVISLATPAG
ncbi:MAG TPA: superoxide dismutase family protein [Sphingomicrobium sp.]|nr:superoxide dismutase family protein [Sphingomicrobium sp.]